MLRLSTKSASSGLIRRLFALALSVTVALGAAAQSGATVSGTVNDSKNQPVAGASVTEPGTSRGTTTNAQGKFTLPVSSSNATIQVTYVGTKTQSIALAGRSNVNVTLEAGEVEIERVVVTALGIKREEKALGYAVSQIDASSLTAGHEQNVMSAMMGKVAGIDISTTSAGPTGSTRVLIRGNSQLSGSNAPLYVIDGIPVDNSQIGGNVDKNGANFDYGDVLSSINPDDIESISVLKGASASALYGAQASNGVIMITTKSGKKGKGLGIEFTSSVSIVELLTQFDDYQRVYGGGRAGSAPLSISDAQGASQNAWGGKLDPNLQVLSYNGEMKSYGNKNNNILSFFDTGITYNNAIAFNGATDRSTFRIAVSDMRSKDIVPKSDLNRTVFTMRGSSKLGKSITIDGQASYTMEDVQNRPALSDNSSNIGNAIIGIAPNFDQKWLASNYKDEYGNYINWNGDLYRFNPYWVINEMKNESSRNRLISQARFTWDLRSDLKFSIRGGLDTYNFRATEYIPPSTPRTESGQTSERTLQSTLTNIEAMLTYTKKICDFDLTAFVGGNIMRSEREGFNITAKKQVVPGLKDVNGFAEMAVEHYIPKKQVNSLFGQVSVGYKGWAYLDATLRIDESSTLPPDNRVYTYPSVSGSIVFSNLFDHGSWLSFGKFRASWAMVGQDTDPYQLSLEYGLKSYTISGTPLGQVYSGSIPNLLLKPTSTYSKELGLDVKFFKSRLGLDLTLYQTNTKDQIMQLPISIATGYSKAMINAGEIQNRGIEITLNATPVQTHDFTWDATFTYSKNDNKVLSLHPDVTSYELGSARWAKAFIYAMENKPYGVIVGPKIKRDPDGNMVLTSGGLPQATSDVAVLGNGNFKDIIGWSNTFKYKNLTLTCVLDAKLGADLYSMTTMMAHAKGISKNTLEGREGWYASEQERIARNISESTWVPKGGLKVKGVTEDGSGGYVPYEGFVNPQLYWGALQDSSPEPFIVDASFVKLREVSVSWNLPEKWLRKTPLTNATLSAYGRNLWVIYDNVSNIDPESTYNNSNGKGFEYGSLPSRRTFGFAVNLKF